MGCGSGCEIVGAVILSQGSGSAVYTKPIPRGGEAAVVSINVSQFASGGAGAEVEVQSKNSNETSWTTADTITSITSTDVYSIEVSGLKQFVRLWLKWEAGSVQGDFMLVNGINFSWLPYS